MSDVKPVVFISYSHKDRLWLEYVRSFFEPLAKQWTLLTWDDEQLRIGDDWKGDIYSALDSCRIFVVLVSRYALASDFILDEEVGRILKRPKGEVQFCPIVVTPYFAEGLDWLDHPNRRPRDDKALSELLDPARDREMAVIAKQIYEIIQKISGKLITAVHSSTMTIMPDQPRTAFPSIVDYGRLPERPHKKLVGRDSELKQLDDAWADEKTRIVSLVAWGGAGKTSLIIEWIMRVRNDGYRNADAVLCWSFYSQGTNERAASGEGFLDWALGKLKVRIDTTSSTVKGERLAEEMSRRRVLFVLDGLEPLQHGPEGQLGALKDQGLRAFLRGLAVKRPASGHSLVVLTTRLAVYDLRKWQDTTAPLIDLTRLSDEAGAALLADSGVTGSPHALREAAHDFAGHALALSLLAGFLKLLHRGDVDQRSAIRAMTEDPKDPGHDQARRVIEAYEKEWFANEPVLLAVMDLIGLFDRPARADCMMALRTKPVIDGLTDAIVDFDRAAWCAAIVRLREVRLLDPEDPSAPDALDAHPLIREWFGDRLKHANEAAWKAAHGRLYEHLRDTTDEGKAPSIENLAPLYQAITHGCRAGRHQEALDEIYLNRICRQRSDGRIEYYSWHQLGAFGSDLAAISWFFDKPYDTPIATLTDRSWVVSEAARCLGAQGRFADAIQAMHATLRDYQVGELWEHATVTAYNLSEAELLVGEVAAAVVTAEQSVAHAGLSNNEIQIIASLTAHAKALHTAGRRAEAELLFADAERRQVKERPGYPILFSLGGYDYCDVLLANGDHAAARNRASQMLEWLRSETWLFSLLNSALNALILGRAHLGLALSIPRQQRTLAAYEDVRTAHIRLDEAVDGARAVGAVHYVPRSLLARATFRRSIADWDGTARDHDEVEELAESGPIKLHLCDTALERARLAFAKIEAFAPLNGLFDNSPPKPDVPHADAIAQLKEGARTNLAEARRLIAGCGYHLRDEELAELEAVLCAEGKFADLRPRI